MHEPGSTFKLASLLAYIEETNRSVDDSVDTGEGELRFYTEIMKDHKPGGFGKITIKETFEKSSNIGVAMLIDDTFKDKPQKYLNYLKKFGFSVIILIFKSLVLQNLKLKIILILRGVRFLYHGSLMDMN